MTSPIDDPFNDPDLADLLGPATKAPPTAVKPVQSPVSEAPVAAPEPAQPVQVPVAPVAAPPPVAARPAPDSELTPEQKEIRDLKHQLALANTKKLDSITPDQEELVIAESPERIIIHFVRDGFTFAGRVWYRGQELAFDPGSKAYEDTKDRYGNSWLVHDDMAQADIYGRVFFRRGPWPGKRYDDPTAEEQEKQRRMAAPAMPRF